MKVLVIGKGAREHAIVAVLKRSKNITQIFMMPGNGGGNFTSVSMGIDTRDDMKAIVRWAVKNQIDWTVVGGELPATLGITDLFEEAGLACFGVSEKASLLESSKAFAKNLMNKCGIATADHKVFDSFEKANSYVLKQHYPLVVKADGLFAGKGVIICPNYEFAKKALEDIFLVENLDNNGQKVVIEDFLVGKEISAFVLCDGRTILPLMYVQDYKKNVNGCKGKNTGGMGSYAPVGQLDDGIKKQIEKHIFEPIIDALRKEGIVYKGVLYAGLIVEDDKVKVLEFNVRFGDPEAQVILPLLKTDFVDVLKAVHLGKLDELCLEWDSRFAICVVMASQGYPDDYEVGFPITGLDKALGNPNIEIYHAGTTLKNGNLVSAGGRVLSVVALGNDLKQAYFEVYRAVSSIDFDNKYYRTDIAYLG